MDMFNAPSIGTLILFQWGDINFAPEERRGRGSNGLTGDPLPLTATIIMYRTSVVTVTTQQEARLRNTLIIWFTD